VHRTLGPGLLESTYIPCLQFELRAISLKFVAQRAIPIVYKGIVLEASYRIDLIVGITDQFQRATADGRSEAVDRASRPQRGAKHD